MLECALLERQEECYENDYERVNWAKMQERLNLVESKYGRDLRSILQEILSPSLPQRIDWTTLIHRLNGNSKAASLNEQV